MNHQTLNILEIIALQQQIIKQQYQEEHYCQFLQMQHYYKKCSWQQSPLLVHSQTTHQIPSMIQNVFQDQSSQQISYFQQNGRDAAFKCQSPQQSNNEQAMRSLNDLFTPLQIPQPQKDDTPTQFRRVPSDLFLKQKQDKLEIVIQQLDGGKSLEISEQNQENFIQRASSCQSESSYSLSKDEQNLSKVVNKKKSFKQCVAPRKLTKKISKNIPKNIFKGIMKYIMGRKDEIKQYFQNKQDKITNYIQYIKHSKNTALSMQQIKNFLHCKKNEEFSKLSRILSYHFVDKNFVAYIYNSKIKCRKEHLAHRRKFLTLIRSQN